MLSYIEKQNSLYLRCLQFRTWQFSISCLLSRRFVLEHFRRFAQKQLSIYRPFAHVQSWF